MASKFDYESSVFNPFLIKDKSIHNEVDPDVNFFQDIPYYDEKCTNFFKQNSAWNIMGQH